MIESGLLIIFIEIFLYNCPAIMTTVILLILPSHIYVNDIIIILHCLICTCVPAFDLMQISAKKLTLSLKSFPCSLVLNPSTIAWLSGEIG